MESIRYCTSLARFGKNPVRMAEEARCKILAKRSIDTSVSNIYASEVLS